MFEIVIYIMKQRYVVNYCKVFSGEEIPLVMCVTRVCLDNQYCSILLGYPKLY